MNAELVNPPAMLASMAAASRRGNVGGGGRPWQGDLCINCRKTVQEEQGSMYDVMVFDHRLAEHRPLDSKA
ncbi:MAG TPA: hypothetical protein VNK73_18215, partial [Actinomycetota bacterium]|nr:hypothetical protein [Actinomycetota bacterium]